MANLPVHTIVEETGSDLSGADSGTSESPANSPDSASLRRRSAEDAEETDAASSAPARHDESAPLLQRNNPEGANNKKGRFTITKSPDISRSDFYSANMESVFRNMEPVAKKAKPSLTVDVAKANGQVPLDVPLIVEPTPDDPEGAHKPALLTVVNETGSVSATSRRPSKLFTVINYGNVETEQVPTTPVVSAAIVKSESEALPWHTTDSQGSRLALRELFSSQNTLHNADRRRSSLLSAQKSLSIRPRVRLVSGCQSFDVDGSLADDILSINPRDAKGGHFNLRADPPQSKADLSNNAEVLDEACAGRDLPDNKYATQQSVHGSASYLSKTLRDVARRGRLFARRKTGRLILKDGTPNLTLKHIKTKNHMFMLDIFTTVLDMQWRWVLFVFCLAFVFSWLAFAGNFISEVPSV